MSTPATLRRTGALVRSSLRTFFYLGVELLHGAAPHPPARSRAEVPREVTPWL